MRVKDCVEAKLKYSKELRDSDKKLLLSIWADEGLSLTKDQYQTFMNKCSVAESITRARRELKVKYSASEAVDEVRYNKYVKARHSRGESITEEPTNVKKYKFGCKWCVKGVPHGVHN